MSGQMTSLQRVSAVLSGEMPDRVPMFLSAGLHGPGMLGVSMREYFGSAELMAQGQLLKRELYRDDIITPFSYAAAEVEAFGQESVFYDDGPPNAGRPVIERPSDIERLVVPRIEDSPSLLRGVEVTRQLAAHAPDAAILGVVIAPNSLPVMQMGFERYLDLVYERPELHQRLLEINEEFCANWANAQLDAGAHVIAFFDPLSSPSIMPREIFESTGLRSAKRTFSEIRGSLVALLASGSVIPVMDDFIELGVAGVSVGPDEDLAQAKSTAADRCAVIGNLNGIEMRNWTPTLAEKHVREAIDAAGAGGGYILCDGHGELPHEVPGDIIEAISDAVHRWGGYPSNTAVHAGARL